MIKSFYKLLKQIEHRPALYTGQSTLKSLHTYLSGYKQALIDNNLTQYDDQHDPFFDWVANKLGFYESTAGWANMILAVTIGLDSKRVDWNNFDSKVTREQHELSFKKFYELLEEYINE
ncbi:hypothetical protein WNY78_03115 [Psychroserpens sp. AS72]|uniref:hypothetical protein n=1 Tax=Psychroserpens sp. AS72 TaxID=3135775 RepID=UPI00316C4357